MDVGPGCTRRGTRSTRSPPR